MSETPVACDTTPLEVNLSDVHLTREPLDLWTSLSTQKPGHQEPIRTTPPLVDLELAGRAATGGWCATLLLLLLIIIIIMHEEA